MDLSTEQIQAVANGEAVPVNVDGTNCVLVRQDVYSRVEAVLDVDGAYPLLDESFREGWEAAGMEDYDRYEEMKT